MAEIEYDADINLKGNSLVNALLNPRAADPGAPVAGQVWFNTSDSRLKYHDGTLVQTLARITDVSGAGISGTFWDAQTVLVAVADNDPNPVTVTPSSLIGRLAGGDVGVVTFADMVADAGIATTAALTAAVATSEAAANTYTDAQIALLKGTIVDTDLDTIRELADAILGNDTDLAALLTLVNARARVFTQNIGNGASTSFAVTHNFTTSDVAVSVIRNSDNKQIITDWTVTNANTVTVSTSSVPAAGAYRVVVFG